MVISTTRRSAKKKNKTLSGGRISKLRSGLVLLFLQVIESVPLSSFPLLANGHACRFFQILPQSRTLIIWVINNIKLLFYCRLKVYVHNSP